jgi:hypothetical protein
VVIALDEPFVSGIAQLQIAQSGAMPPEMASMPWQRAQFWA